MMKTLLSSSFLGGGNAAYLEEQYEAWLTDPSSVASNWRTYFEQLPTVNGADQETLHSEVREQFSELTRNRGGRVVASDAAAPSLEQERKQVRVQQLINAYRMRGHQWANINPLSEDTDERTQVREMELRENGLSAADLDRVFNAGNLYGPEQATLRDIINRLEKTYCGSIGIEYTHVLDTTQKEWLRQRMESVEGKPTFDFETRKWLLERLTAAEGIEKYLHSKYVGQKRFSLEGGESLIPLMAEVVQRAGSVGVKETVFAMAHRGRLNVLVNILGKKPAELFSEFEGVHTADSAQGDVKYHQGFSSDVETKTGGEMHITLAFNPSHLEIVGPVIEGSVRSRQDRRNDDGSQVLPLIVHGDAAFAGQGVVMETFNMAYVRAYSTQGTIHVVVNNQVGFTTNNPEDARSTIYCTDVAKMINSPILHVNGDDPEAVLYATQVAFDYRMKFKKDVIIDLVCYRRHGHNEADEPSATQPLMYRKIKALPTTRKLYGESLERSQILTDGQADALVRTFRDHMDQGDIVAPGIIDNAKREKSLAIDWDYHANRNWRDDYESKVPQDKLQQLASKLTDLPDGYELHPRVRRIVEDRRKMTIGELPVDWGYAENLAYATLLDAGHAVRITGQDVGRGTFFHRHAVLHHQQSGESYTPLQHIADDQPKMEIYDSVLSEEAVLAFEYGYATTDPSRLVIWEAQFGDFANGAQMVIDQFITSGEAKWGRLCGLVMLLPHGYEGQGPEHSSARLERFLQLCARDNMQVMVPSTPAQCYHMLRQQMLRPLRQPMIVMSPKSLLRHKLAVNTLEDLAEGRFQPVLDEIDDIDPTQAKRLLLCSGKLYYDILERRRAEGLDNVVIARVEQLYPFPYKEVDALMAKYKSATEVVWCQEEPRNQGAWFSSRHRIERCLLEGQTVSYAGRLPSASPAVGYAKEHAKEQKLLVEQALGLAVQEKI